MNQENDLIVKDTPNGKGVFVKKNWKKGEKIMDFGGKFFTFDTLPTPYDEVEDHFVQIGDDLYMGPSGSTDDFLNHSCDGNAGLQVAKDKVTLIAIRDIVPGEEVTWDYSTTMDEDDWVLDCMCGSPKCRGKVRDFKYLPKEIQQKYIEAGVVPQYILDNMKDGIKVKEHATP